MPGFWITSVSNILQSRSMKEKEKRTGVEARRSDGVRERQLPRVVKRRREWKSVPMSFRRGKHWKEVINNFISLRKVSNIDKETYQTDTHVSQFLGREIMKLKMKAENFSFVVSFLYNPYC